MSVAEFDSRRIRRMRTYTWWTLVPLQPFYAVFPVVNLVTGVRAGFYGTVEIVVLSLVLLATVFDGLQLSTILMEGLGRGQHRPVRNTVVFAFTLAALAYALTQHPTGVLWSMPLGGLAGLHVPAAPYRLRWPLTIGTALLTGVVATIASSPHNPLPGLATGLYAMFIVSLSIFVIIVAVWFWDIVLGLDRARAVSADLAVANERLRFAADLHDIQGHHLQVIALKGELAERLVGRDDAAARALAAEIAELARTALKDTRDVVHGYRHTKLTTELENAQEILEAAGVKTTVDGDAAAVPPPLQPLFGALVREGTTNILRHSRAENCELSISVEGPRTSLVLRNDRAKSPNGAAGSGIEGLRQRFRAVGGHVEADLVEDWFELRGAATELGRTS
ncbi:histidine kinase [Saccharopolyspora sp. NPDC000359]|uniref:sensor histidine kinase n=1 Tax=Saccharopolyspora sp. NPDC000359 TaxID=3154251 RepID=UPI00331EF139